MEGEPCKVCHAGQVAHFRSERRDVDWPRQKPGVQNCQVNLEGGRGVAVYMHIHIHVGMRAYISGTPCAPLPVYGADKVITRGQSVVRSQAWVEENPSAVLV